MCALFQKNDIANFNIMLQEEVFLIKAHLRKSFGEESWLTGHEHLWLEEDFDGFPLKETSLAKIVTLTQGNKSEEKLVDVESLSGLHE